MNKEKEIKMAMDMDMAIVKDALLKSINKLPEEFFYKNSHLIITYLGRGGVLLPGYSTPFLFKKNKEWCQKVVSNVLDELLKNSKAKVIKKPWSYEVLLPAIL